MAWEKELICFVQDIAALLGGQQLLVGPDLLQRLVEPLSVMAGSLRCLQKMTTKLLVVCISSAWPSVHGFVCVRSADSFELDSVPPYRCKSKTQPHWYFSLAVLGAECMFCSTGYRRIAIESEYDDTASSCGQRDLYSCDKEDDTRAVDQDPFCWDPRTTCACNPGKHDRFDDLVAACAPTSYQTCCDADNFVKPHFESHPPTTLGGSGSGDSRSLFGALYRDGRPVLYRGSLRSW